MSSTIGIIGSGAIGSAVARLAIAAGYHVIVSNSRGPETLEQLVNELGPRARAATATDAARQADIVVAAVQFRFHNKLPVEALTGKTVIDTMNYFPEFDGIFPELDARHLASSELVQQHLPHSHVVKVLNNLDSVRLFTTARPRGDTSRSALALSGDDAHAKHEAAAFVDGIGYDPVEIGTLADSWRQEAGTPVNVLPYLPIPAPGLTDEYYRNWWSSAPGNHVSVEQVRELTAKAVRSGRVGGSSQDWVGKFPGM